MTCNIFKEKEGRKEKGLLACLHETYTWAGGMHWDRAEQNYILFGRVLYKIGRVEGAAAF